MIGLRVLIGVHSLSFVVIGGRKTMFEVSSIDDVVGFEAMRAKHKG